MKKFLLSTIAAIVAILAAPSIQASDWYMEGSFNGWEKTYFEDKGDGVFEAYVYQFTGDFFICDSTGTSYGGTELLYANEEYKLVKDGNNIFFPEDVTYISDAIVTFNVNNETLLVSGTPVSEQAISQIAFVAGSFNNNVAGDPYAMLTLEPGTQIYSGRVAMEPANGDKTVTWLIYTSDTDPDNNVWGAMTASDDTNCLEGYLMEGSKTTITTAAGKYDFWFNSATGQFRLTPVTNTTEKSITIDPSTAEIHNRFADFLVTFNGYNTAVLDPTMYDIFNGPGTFINVETNEVVARVGGQPFPIVNNTILLQLSQTIFNQEYLDVDGTPEQGEIDKYEAYPNGAYVLSLPAGSIMLNDGTATFPNDPLEFLFTLGDIHTSGIKGVAAEFEAMDIYTLNGVLKAKNATAEDINALPKGVYVVKGRKFIVR